MPGTASDKTIGRLSLYRRLLVGQLSENASHVYSHQLAKAAGVTAAQVRRDLMVVGYTGSPTKGYDVRQLAESIRIYLDGPLPQSVALVGVGNLGRAILSYFSGRRPNLSIVAAFDKDPAKIGRVIHGCPCHDLSKLAEIVAEQGILTAILAVPAANAQVVADMATAAGVRGLLNFAPAHVRVPVNVYVENVDITTSLEKVAFFARREANKQGSAK